MIPQRQKGIFKIQCKSNDDFKKLKKFKLAIKNAKGEQGRSICLELPREHKPRGREFYDGTFVTIIGACENGLEQEENSEFDKSFFSVWHCGKEHVEPNVQRKQPAKWKKEFGNTTEQRISNTKANRLCE